MASFVQVERMIGVQLKTPVAWSPGGLYFSYASAQAAIMVLDCRVRLRMCVCVSACMCICVFVCPLYISNRILVRVG